MTRTDYCALLLCLVSLFANALVANRVFENIPHLEDETTLVWQAETITRGQLWTTTPPSPAAFLVPFVVDYQGHRFGKYPLGFPVLLSFGMRLGLRDWVNPFIAACTLWLIYRLAKKLLDEKTALLAAFLTATSPFFLINSANLLAHAWSLFLSVSLALAWVDTFFYDQNQEVRFTHSVIPPWLTLSVAGLSLGALVLTRPWTAVGVALPFFAHGVYLLWKGVPAQRRQVIAIGLLAGGIASLHFLWQAALTGSPWTNPYTLWWPSDVIGFGPGVGFRPGGHTLNAGMWDVLYSLLIASHDVLGWPYLSWIFLPFGILAIRGSRPARLVSLVFPTLVLVYVAYWVTAWIYGPRYYYEGLYSWTILSAAGIAWIYRRLPLHRLAVRIKDPKGFRTSLREREARPLGSALQVQAASFIFTTLLALLIAGNLFIYAPERLDSLHGLYRSYRALLAPFTRPEALALTPALIIVHDISNFHRYVTLTQLASPALDSPFIFALSTTPQADQALVAQFPDRQVYHYYFQTPERFYNKPLP